MATYQRGMEFPHEGFVQKTIEGYFFSRGFTILEEDYTDLVCVCGNSQKKWAIEAKGKTTDIGSYFRTGLGQLVQRMKEQETNYAIAVPEIDQFIKQCTVISKWVRVSLNLHIIFVGEQGNVRIVSPHEELGT